MLLLDTHALIWWILGITKLSERARAAIGYEGTKVFVSAASAWEVTTKVRVGKLPEAAAIALNFAAVLERQGFEALPISLHHAILAGRLPGDHRDPFDRMLIAQALTENLVMVSNDRAFDAFGVARLW